MDASQLASVDAQGYGGGRNLWRKDAIPSGILNQVATLVGSWPHEIFPGRISRILKFWRIPFLKILLSFSLPLSLQESRLRVVVTAAQW